MHIGHLADHAAAIPTLARWFRDKWPEHYASHTLAEVEREFSQGCSRERLPIVLVAFCDDRLAGTIAIRERALDSQPEGPGLGGLYVIPIERARGLGSALVRAGVDEAKRLGHSTVYTGTSVAQGLLRRLGWLEVRTVLHGGEDVTLFRCDP
jgi:predicted N-acetyltransferase YhbS